MARGCGNNSIELWYYGKGNISAVNIPTKYAVGTAYQDGSTITGVGTTWTEEMEKDSFEFVSDDTPAVITQAGEL